MWKIIMGLLMIFGSIALAARDCIGTDAGFITSCIGVMLFAFGADEAMKNPK